MGFIQSASTVTVSAKLTAEGKKKLFESIESNSSGFITKFALGDSDANYAAITAGAGTLESGHVPEASDFRPEIRSFALSSGQYRPGIPVLLINGEYGTDDGVHTSISIGANEAVQVRFEVTTEWPKNEAWVEGYKIEVLNPGNLSGDLFDRLFTVVNTSVTGSVFQYNGGIANIEELSQLIGAYGSGGHTTVPVKVTGQKTNAHVIYNIELVQ